MSKIGFRLVRTNKSDPFDLQKPSNVVHIFMCNFPFRHSSKNRLSPHENRNSAGCSPRTLSCHEKSFKNHSICEAGAGLVLKLAMLVNDYDDLR